jgi:nicotinamidase-related amidase
VINEPTKGVFTFTDFELLLRNRGIRNLVLCGVCTDICVRTTTREANGRGYECLLVQDACGATIPTLRVEAAVSMAGTEGGIFGTTCTTASLLQTLGTI